MNPYEALMLQQQKPAPAPTPPPATGAPLIGAGRAPSMFNAGDWWRFNNPNQLLPRASWAEALDPYMEAIFSAGKPQPGSPSTMPGASPPMITAFPLTGMPGLDLANQPDPSKSTIDDATLASQAAMGDQGAAQELTNRQSQGPAFQPSQQPIVVPQQPQVAPTPAGPPGFETGGRGNATLQPPPAQTLTPTVPTGAGGGGGFGFQSLPGLPPSPNLNGAVNMPDLIGLDPYPTAPSMVNPDYSKADAYMQASKPGDQHITSDADLSMMLLAGMAQGYGDGSGSVGQLLGRMAGPGLAAYTQGKAGQRDEQRQADALLAQWNQAMGNVESGKAETSANTTNTNAQNRYNRDTAKRSEDLSLYQWGDERNRDQARMDLERWKAAAQAIEADNNNAYRNASLGLQAKQIDAYNQRYAGGGASMASFITGIQNAVKTGVIPGSGVDLNARKQELRQALTASEPMLMGNPQALENRVNQLLFSEVYQNAIKDPAIAMSIMQMSSKGQGLAFLDALAAGE